MLHTVSLLANATYLLSPKSSGLRISYVDGSFKMACGDVSVMRERVLAKFGAERWQNRATRTKSDAYLGVDTGLVCESAESMSEWLAVKSLGAVVSTRVAACVWCVLVCKHQVESFDSPCDRVVEGYVDLDLLGDHVLNGLEVLELVA